MPKLVNTNPVERVETTNPIKLAPFTSLFRIEALIELTSVTINDQI